MKELFGIPINELVAILLVLFAVFALGLTVRALRNRVMFKIAARNLPRRPAQTVLISMGLMLAAMLFSASFTTGDTMSHSIRTLAVKGLGEVDIIVQSELEETSTGAGFGDMGGTGGRPSYFAETDQSIVSDTLQDFIDDGTVEGIAPAIMETVPVASTQLAEPAVDLLGLDPTQMEPFGFLDTKDGDQLSLEDLGEGEIYVSEDIADELEVDIGDIIDVYLGARPIPLTIAGIYEEGANPAGDESMVLPLSHLQSLMANAQIIDEGEINGLLITNAGDAIAGADHSDAVMEVLEPTLEGTGLEAEPIKQDVLDAADLAGSMFTAIFVMFAQFSVVAGILLIFLIFVMLAAERKRDLGIARAVGTQRGHVIRMFTYEGVLYALIASAVGSLLGMAFGWLMVRIMATAFGQAFQGEFTLTFDFQPQSLILSYIMGVLLTLIVVVISAWRVSNLNIVRAIKDIPEPQRQGVRSRKGLILAIIATLLGGMMMVSGFQSEQATPYLLGGSLIIIGLPLLARRFGLPDRPAFTAAGLGLLIWWLIPISAHPGADSMNQTIDLFFLSGIMVVAGTVWVIIYNSDLLLGAILAIFGRIQALAPILKTAVSYPLAARFRTGMALAMFSLIIFTLVVMSIINSSFLALYSDTERLSGGFDIQAIVNPLNPITDMEATIEQSETLQIEDFDSIAAVSFGPIEMRQADTDQDWEEDLFLEGVDRTYSENISYQFALTTEEFTTARDVWQTLSDRPGTAIVTSALVPSRVNYNVGGPPAPFQLEGFYKDDADVLPSGLFIDARHPITGEEQRLEVIGLLDDAAFPGAMVVVSDETLSTLMPNPTTPVTYLFQINPQVEDLDALAKDLEAEFLNFGMETVVMEEVIDDLVGANRMINDLLTGFMGLGLIVGIAALSIIAARSVVERRQQIGMLRAIGFQQKMVQSSFLLESSFVALMGIVSGVILGTIIGAEVVADSSQTIEGVDLVIPWSRIVLIVALAYFATLLTTFLPARQASKIYPAEALRYE